MSAATRRFMKNAGIERINVDASGLAAFRERTSSFMELRWKEATDPAHIKSAMEMYGFDCYLQGLLDGNSDEVQKILTQGE